jgi:hypothetical protein
MTALRDALQTLELELHHPGRPCSRERLEQLLHPDFHEVGRSGRAYDRATVIAWLGGPTPRPDVHSSGFAADLLAPGIALLTFRSTLRPGGGGAEEITLRASLWVQTAAGWQLRYHQGTPAAPSA